VEGNRVWKAGVWVAALVTLGVGSLVGLDAYLGASPSSSGSPGGAPAAPTPASTQAQAPTGELSASSAPVLLGSVPSPSLPSPSRGGARSSVAAPTSDRPPTLRRLASGVAPETSGSRDEVRGLLALPVEAGVGAQALVTRAGRPAAGVRVRAYPRDQLGGFPLGEADSDRAGRVRLPDVRGGLTLVARTENELACVDLGAARDTPTLELVPLPKVVAGWAEAGSRVQVTSARGHALGGARLSFLLGQRVLCEGGADAEGRLAILRLSVPDHVTVRVSAPDHAPRYLSADGLARPSRRGVVHVRLRPGGTGVLSGRVLDVVGNPLPGARVRLLREGGTPARVAADRAGHFRVADLAPGLLTLECYGDGELPQALGSASIRAGTETEVTLHLRRLGELEVYVRAGTPVARAEVSIVDPAVTRFGSWEQSKVEQSATCDGRGRARFHLPPGRYYVRASDPRTSRTGLGWVEVRAGLSARASISLARQRALRVKVVDRAGNPVPGVFMDVSAPGIAWRDMPGATTSHGGVADFQSLPAGRAELHLGLAGQWRMVVTQGDEATFTWTPPRTVKLKGSVAARGHLLAVIVLPDVAKTFDVPTQGKLDQDLSAPDGDWEAYLLPLRSDWAPLRLRAKGATLQPVSDTFPRAGSVSGRLTLTGKPVPGQVRVAGRLGAVVEARAQWTSRTANDEWITINEWHQASAPDGRFRLDSLPPGTHTLRLSAVGAGTREVVVRVQAGKTTAVGEVAIPSSP
jgi:hypothetical protein